MVTNMTTPVYGLGQALPLVQTAPEIINGIPANIPVTTKNVGQLIFNEQNSTWYILSPGGVAFAFAAASSSLLNNLAGNSGTASPVAGTINVVGTGSISTTASGNTVTISSSGSSGVNTLTGNTGGAISPSSGNINIVGSGSVNVSGSGSTLTISSSGMGITWNSVSSSQTMVSENGYVVSSGSVSLQLPTTSAFGDEIIITLASTGTSWMITQGAGQSILLGDLSTTAGVGGSLSSTQIGDSVTLVCTVANLSWMAIAAQGNITVI